MPIIKNSTPVRDYAGSVAIGRTLRFYRRDTGELLGETLTSDGTDGLEAGYFEFSTPYSGDVQVVGLAEGVDNDKQDIIYRVRT